MFPKKWTWKNPGRGFKPKEGEEPGKRRRSNREKHKHIPERQREIDIKKFIQ